jgi:CHASE3 domain sensor protein
MLNRMYFTATTAPLHRLPLYKTILCVACVLILIANGFSLFHNLQSLKGANALQSQSSRVADRLQYLNVLVLDAESSLRGYFISGRESYLGPARTAVTESESEFRELEKLLADSPSQLKNLAQLHTLVRRKLALLNQSIDVYREGGLDEIVKIAKVSDGRSSMDEIRLQVVIMEQEQYETLAARSAMFYHQYQKAVLLGMGINAMAIIVLIMFYQLVRRSFRNRAAVEHALQKANENLESTVAQRTEQLSVLSRHLISISEEEKVRLSRELHDELGANLTSIGMDIAAVTQQLQKTAPELATQLRRARDAGRNGGDEAPQRRKPAPQPARQPGPVRGHRKLLRRIQPPGPCALRRGYFGRAGKGCQPFRRLVDRAVPYRAGVADQYPQIRAGGPRVRHVAPYRRWPGAACDRRRGRHCGQHGGQAHVARHPRDARAGLAAGRHADHTARAQRCGNLYRSAYPAAPQAGGRGGAAARTGGHASGRGRR